MTSRDPRLRLFVALELPEAWLTALSEAQTSLQRSLEADGGPRLRWVRPEGIHLTLKFLGEVPSERLPELDQALSDAVPVAPDLALRLARAGCFVSRRRVGVLWAGVDGDIEALVQLAARIDSACADQGFAPERRAFQPHLTLARVPDRVDLRPDAIEAHLQSLSFDSIPPFSVRRISLMRSHLGPASARYERLAAWPELPLQPPEPRL